MKKLTAIIVSVIIILMTVFPSFAEEKQMSNYEILLNKGYPAEFLDKLTDEVIQRVVNAIGDGYVADVEINKVTLKESNDKTRGAINENSMDLLISAESIYQSNSNKVTKVVVLATWEWAANKPVYRGQDAVTVNWDNTLFSYDADSFYAQDLYKSNVNDEWSIFNEYTKLAASNQGGIGHWTDLKGLKKYVGGVMSFFLNPNSPMIKGTTYNTSINLEYAHAPVPLTGLSLSILDVGIGISWNLTCDTMSGTSNFKFSR